MRLVLFLTVLWLSTLFASIPVRSAEPSRFEWKDGDRVVLIGDDLIEREQKYGYIETWITAANPDKSITFRNLGWSGDTVYGLARAGFGKEPDGTKHLIEHVLALKPTVLIVGYGMAESFDGERGLSRFVDGLNALLDSLASTKARVILLSPIRHEKMPDPLPDPDKHNKNLKIYTTAIEDVAHKRGSWFINLFEPQHKDMMVLNGGPQFAATDDGIHLNAVGYWKARAAFVAFMHGPELNQNNFVWSVELQRSPTSKTIGFGSILGTKLSEVAWTPAGITFQAIDESLPDSPAPHDKTRFWNVLERSLAIRTLFPGTSMLKIDGKVFAQDSGVKWVHRMIYEDIPERIQVEALRAAIIAKNELYFYRWRPQNETYLFGFRKYEQGNNAREIPLFDPLVEEKEKEIAKLRKPVPHVYELTRENEVTK